MAPGDGPLRAGRRAVQRVDERAAVRRHRRPGQLGPGGAAHVLGPHGRRNLPAAGASLGHGRGGAARASGPRSSIRHRPLAGVRGGVAVRAIRRQQPDHAPAHPPHQSGLDGAFPGGRLDPSVRRGGRSPGLVAAALVADPNRGDGPARRFSGRAGGVVGARDRCVVPADAHRCRIEHPDRQRSSVCVRCGRDRGSAARAGRQRAAAHHRPHRLWRDSDRRRCRRPRLPGPGCDLRHRRDRLRVCCGARACRWGARGVSYRGGDADG